MSYNRLGIGLGVNNPDAVLHIRDDTNSSLLLENTGGAGAISEIRFLESGDSGVKMIYSSDQNQLWMTTRISGTDASTPSLILDRDTGRVGIGSTTPQQLLDIDGNININGTIYLGGSPAAVVSQWVNNASDIYYDIGNVGIGTDTPGHRLDVRNAGQVGISIRDTTQAGTGWRIDQGSNGSSFSIVENGVQTPLTVLQTSGNVGIGSLTPASKLDVDGDVRVRNSIYVNDTTPISLVNYEAGRIETVPAETNAATKMVFKTGQGVYTNMTMVGGNVGIGTISPNVPLHTEGKIFINDTTGITGGQGTTMVIRNQQTNTSIFQIQGTGISTVAEFSSNGNVGIGTTEMVFYNGSSYQVMPSKLGVFMDVASGVRGRGLFVLNNGNSSATDQIVFQAAAADAQPGYEGLVVNGQSNVGIGTLTPQAKLHIQGSVADTFTWNSYYDYFGQYSAGQWDPQDPNFGLSVYATHAVVAEMFGVLSDARIKKDIQQINDGAALSKLRLIEPTEYNYIDVVNKTRTRVFGFIAQQVREHFPEATKLSRGIVPDIYGIFSMELQTQMLTIPGKAKTGKLRLITKSRQLDVEVTAPSPDTVQLPEGTLTESDIHDGKVFVYGYEVEDFHTLNKDYLFTINFAATQELDRKVQTLETENASLKTEVSGLRSELQALRDVLRDKGLIE